jgi:hypothetical protein
MISKSEDVREWLLSIPDKELKRACRKSGISYYNTIMPFLTKRKTITLKVLDRLNEAL